MIKKLKIIDAIQGQISLAKNKRNYFKTKDSTSKSGHSLIAQIDMTHSGIVTRNYGFYLPARMKAGARTFTQDYAKPLLVGHDEDGDTRPVGRIVSAEYIDTAETYRNQDKYLQSLYSFQDGKKNKDGMLDFVNHVIQDYSSRDGYKGLGTIRGTLRVEDAETIEAILDNRYLTVSTSMMSDSATCNICGTDWVEDGLCDHNRGQTYEDNVCVVVPGAMSYDHLGIVNTPADPHAHDFTIIGNEEPIIPQMLNSVEREHRDCITVANIFACNNKDRIIPLSEEKEINLIDIKDNIQKMENAMTKKKLEKTIEEKIKDALDIKVEVYRYSDPSNGQGSKEVSVREYMETLDPAALQAMVEQISAMIGSDSLDVDTAVTSFLDKTFTKAATEEEKAAEKKKKKGKKKNPKVMDENFKLIEGKELEDSKLKEILEGLSFSDETTDVEKEVVEAIRILLEGDDALTSLAYSSDDSAEEILKKYNELKDSKELKALSSDEVSEIMESFIPKDSVLTADQKKELKASDFCGMKGYFPVVNKDYYLAAKKALGQIKASDSIKGRILVAIEKKAKKIGLDLTDSFDNLEDTCNNDANISEEELIVAFESAKKVLEDRGIEIPGFSQNDAQEKDQEIEILESQLEAANEELDSAILEKGKIESRLKEQLAIRAVDMKILSEGFEMSDRVKEVENHKVRTLDSLVDTIRDLEAKAIVEKDGLSGEVEEKVTNPVLGSNKDEVSKKEKKNDTDDKYKLYDEYNMKVTRYGRVEADRWLKKIQNKNGNIPTID